MINKKRLMALGAVALTLISSEAVLSGCSEKKDPTLTLSTTLETSSSFSGKRTFTVQFPDTFADPTRAAELDMLMEKYCPEPLSYTKGSNGGAPQYTFLLAFSSYPDYISKLTSVLGTKPVVVFSNPSTVLTSGWRIEEYFSSSMLLDWLKIAARFEKLDGYDISATENETYVRFLGESVPTLPTISVNRLTGYPISDISLSTVNKKTTFDRTISFTIPQTTFDSLGDSLTQYFSSITDTSAESGWQLENNNYIYTVSFSELTEKQLEGYTNRLLSSVYGDISYVDKASGSTPLAFQNSYTETLDFSAYIGENNSDVPIHYTYSIDDNTQISDPLIYSDFEWTAASDILETSTESGAEITFGGGAPSMTLRINDGKQYTPRSVDISLTPLDNDTIEKSYTFRFDAAENGMEAAAYAASYFKENGITAEQKGDGADELCTITFKGNQSELNASITDIFGDSNLVLFDSYTPFMKLRTRKVVTDNVDLSTVLVGKNAEVPVNYTLISRDGELAEGMSAEIKSADPADKPEKTEIEPDENGVYKTTFAASGALISSEVSVANWQDIIVFIIISVLAVLIAVAVILLLKIRTDPAPGLSGGRSDTKTLPKKKPDESRRLSGKNSKKDEP